MNLLSCVDAGKLSYNHVRLLALEESGHMSGTSQGVNT